MANPLEEMLQQINQPPEAITNAKPIRWKDLLTADGTEEDPSGPADEIRAQSRRKNREDTPPQYKVVEPK